MKFQTNKLELEEMLEKGSDNATSFETLLKYYKGASKRELLALIERKRRSGIAILSKKYDGGGYFLPRDKKELDIYLAEKKSEVITVLETLISIRNEKRTPIPESLEKLVKAI